MKKTTKIISLAALLIAGIPQNSDAQFLKRIEKALDTVNKTLENINQQLDPENQTQQAVEENVTERKAEATQAVTNVVNNAAQKTTDKVAEYVAPEFLVRISGNKVNVRKSPSTSGEVLTQASAGTLYEFVSEKDGWFEVKIPGMTGNAYVSATVAAKQSLAALPRTDKVVKAANTDLVYQKVENTSRYSLTTSYKITQGSKAGEVNCTCSSFGAYADGRFIPASEEYYKGTQLGWCIVLNQMKSYDDSWETMETPIMIYAVDAAGNKITVSGETFTLAREDF